MKRNFDCLGSGTLFLAACLLMTGDVLAANCINAAQSGENPISATVDLPTQANAATASPVLKSLFGFNAQWRNFQLGYLTQGGAVKPEVVQWMTPFSGAVYRYPGGSPSNWFQWKKSIGDISSRPPMYFDYGQSVVARFGLDEFLDFVNSVGGIPLITVNITGENGNIWPIDKIAQDAHELALHLKSRLSTLQPPVVAFGSSPSPAAASSNCASNGLGCAGVIFELGNEVDWPPYSWQPQQYIDRVRAVVPQIKSVFPDAPVIAQLRTSPWSSKWTKDALSFSEQVPHLAADILDGYAFHPYYDGINVTNINRIMDHELSLYPNSRVNKAYPLFITEHARWPDQPVVGDWRTNWYQTGDLGGAISSTDFILSLMPRGDVGAATWWTMGVSGPWQLIYQNSTSGSLYPNAVYWALRAVRESTFDNLVVSGLVVSQSPSYSGGYDGRYVITADASFANASLVMVNRSNRTIEITVNDGGNLLKGKSIKQYTVEASSLGDRNTDQTPNAVVMAVNTLGASSDTTTNTYCVAPRSITTFVFQ